MTSNTRSFRNFRNPIGCLVILAAFAAAAGCSTSQSTNGDKAIVNHVLPSGSSVAGWLVVPSGGTHASSATLDYIGNGGGSGCTECHGADLTGGISKVSCFGNPSGCHHGPVANWTSPTVHGATAKKAPGNSGFASCQICHAADFSGGGAQVPCSRCHVVNAPHPSQWNSTDTYKHSTTDPGNAAVCALCHRSAAGTPNCFNNTLCHGEAGAPHPLGNPAWFATPPAAQPHGNAAKATPSSAAGFAYCQVCHGTGTTPPANFGGGFSGVSCYDCHSPAPHPSQWNTPDTYRHSTTDPGNAAVCAQCHRSAAGTPGCFNNTLCHGAAGAGHPVPFNDNSHYSVSSATFPGSCNSCHDISLPSAKAGPVCQTCHVAASPLAAPGTCTSCHASPPNSVGPAGAAYPNIAGTHAVHLALDGTGSPVSCSTCHNGLASRTLEHYNRAKSRVAPGDVAFLATYNAQSGASSFLPSAFTCGNVSCHGGTSLNWRSGVIDVNTQCTACHKSSAVAPAQFNDYRAQAGQNGHQAHLGRTNPVVGGRLIVCTDCHNAAKLADPALGRHFLNLSTSAFEGPPSSTVAGTGTYVNSYTAGTRSCAPDCHQNETWPP